MNKRRLLQRFLRYVKVDTTAKTDPTTYPSSPGQLKLGRILVRELIAMGIADARQDDHGIIMATVPSTVAHPTDVIAFCSHKDTSPETTGKGVKPQVIRKYDGGDIVLPGDPTQVIRPSESPELANMKGRTLITTDGTTLLGGDDKAGVSVIMEAANWLMEHPEIKHGAIRVCLTCDEEIGRGVDFVDLAELGAVVCYTLDGYGEDELDVETFSAELAEVTIQGVNIHPSIAKGRMTHAIRAAGEFITRLPRDRLSPESTEDREGFLHPFDIHGGVEEVTIRILLRDFETAKLAEYADLLRGIGAEVVKLFPHAKVDVKTERQYLNLREGLAKEPRAVEFAQKALERIGRTAKFTIVRGGTDGSRLTEKGLPTPNLSCGMHNLHSTLEWACLEEMERSVEWVVSLAEIWAEPKAAK